MPSFESYLEGLKSSTSCCRSASLLIPTTDHDANAILGTLRQWKWTCQSVLVRPWQSRRIRIISPREKSSQTDPRHEYYQCLPTEDELLFLQRKFLSSPQPSHSLQVETVRHHVESKSLIVPLTDDATAFILCVLFEVPVCIQEDHAPQTQHSVSSNNIMSGMVPENHTSEYVSKTISLFDPEQYRKVLTLQKWFSFNGITVVHNCDGNQTVSLTKEVDSFPEPRSPHFSAGGNQQPSNSFTFVDLFAGIGGFRIGMEALGGICTGSCEIDPFARETYRRNFLEGGGQRNNLAWGGRAEFYVNDIARLEIPPGTVDVLCGGFPCQSFSTLASFPSKKDANACSNNQRQGGLHTPQKGKLFFHLLRVLRKAQPKLFVFENVKGLMQVESGTHFQRILYLLKESGYHVTHGIVDSSWFLPQRRERVYLVGVRLDLLSSEKSDIPFMHRQFEEELRRKYKIYGNDIPNADSMDKFDRVLLNNDNQHSTNLFSAQTLPSSRLSDILESHDTVLKQHPHCFLTTSQWQKVCSAGYLQLHSDGSGQLVTEETVCAQTLVSSYRQSYLMHSQFIVPRDSVFLVEQKKRLVAEACTKKGRQDVKQREDQYANDLTLPRFFTPRECCRLQGFPEDFALPFTAGESKRSLISQFYRQIGNAVSPPCVAAVAAGPVSSFLIRKMREHEPSESSSAVFDLMLRASPCRVKVFNAIESKHQS